MKTRPDVVSLVHPVSHPVGRSIAARLGGWALTLLSALCAQNAMAEGQRISRADCVGEQKDLMQYQTGLRYESAQKGIDGIIKYLNDVSLSGAADYEKSISQQRSKNEKRMADDIKRGVQDAAQQHGPALASDDLHLCFSRKKLGRQTPTAPTAPTASSSSSLITLTPELMANWQVATNKVNAEFDIQNKVFEDFMKTAVSKDFLSRMQAVMWYGEQRAATVERHCAICPNRALSMKDANSIIAEAREKCMSDQGTAQTCRAVDPAVLLAAAGNVSPGSNALAGAGSVGQSQVAPGVVRFSGAECEARKRAVIATKIPPNTTITASTETVMFMTKTYIDMIDAGCPGGTPAQRAAERQQHYEAFKTAEDGCNQVQSGGRLCGAYNHFGPNFAAK